MCPNSSSSPASDPSAEEESFGLLLLSVRQGLIRKAERVLAESGFDINLTQFRVLGALHRAGTLSATELARTVEHDGGALTRVLDCLQEKGYLARRPHAKDRRSIEVFLTDAGKAFCAEASPHMLQFNDDVLGALEPAERRQLFALMRRIRARLEQQNDKT